jgi:hypothetical protein
MTPVIYKEIHEESQSQIAEQGIDSNDISMRISLLEVENSKLDEHTTDLEVKSMQLEERKMKVRLTSLEVITKEFTNTAIVNQDHASPYNSTLPTWKYS